MSGSLKTRPCDGCLRVNMTTNIAFTISNQIAVLQLQVDCQASEKSCYGKKRCFYLVAID